MTEDELRAGLHESLLTERLTQKLNALDRSRLAPHLENLDPGSAADRISRHLATLINRAAEHLVGTANNRDSDSGVEAAIHLAELITRVLGDTNDDTDLLRDIPVSPPRVLRAIRRLNPDGSPISIEAPLTPLLDTTVLTNSRGEPQIGHEIRAEISSADAIDVVMAFIRWSGVRPLLEPIRKHCSEGKRLRILTTTYTNSTEQRALEELQSCGASIKVSYDTSQNRLHAKSWIFHRASGYSTAYIGSSNLTHSAQISGLEWNVRLSGAKNPDAVQKIRTVFETYWESDGFADYDRAEFSDRTAAKALNGPLFISPVEVHLRPFQEALLEQLALARESGYQRNLLVAATGTGKTVMAAVDYSRLRLVLPRSRLLFIAHRKEILEQSLATYRHVLRDPSFGELWVGGMRPLRFEHVFASIQTLNAAELERIDPKHFDIVVVDEFHHSPALSYGRIIEHLNPREMLGLTATPERTDGLDVLAFFGGRIAAELRLWDAIDHQYLAPFAYYGVHDGLDLRAIPWKRGRGYDVSALETVMTADHIWAHRVLEKVGFYVANPRSMRALGFCVSVDHARFMAQIFSDSNIRAVAVSGDSPPSERTAALNGLRNGTVQVVFSVDLFNEGVDVRDVDTLLLLRPTESALLFIQQLGRGLRKSDGKICTVLDFVGNHRREFRFDRRFRALIGGSRSDLERQIKSGFPFLPAGCHIELEPVAQDIVLRSLREAIPSDWRSRKQELTSLGDVSLRRFLEESGLELEDLYSSTRSWSELRREVGLDTAPPGPNEKTLLRAIGRLLHIDDPDRIRAYSDWFRRASPPNVDLLDQSHQRLLRMAIASLSVPGLTIEDGLKELWRHPQILRELCEVLDLLPDRMTHVTSSIRIPNVPLRLHARYTRTEILAAFGIGADLNPPDWREGARWDPASKTDIFVLTFDKSEGTFSPTTRYRDYAITQDLIHWESQSRTSVGSAVGQRYIQHLQNGTNIVLFARMTQNDRAFWCLGPASYVSHEGDRPIAFQWRLHNRLPADLLTSFAAVAA